VTSSSGMVWREWASLLRMVGSEFMITVSLSAAPARENRLPTTKETLKNYQVMIVNCIMKVAKVPIVTSPAPTMLDPFHTIHIMTK